jgi:hypothetical protein
MSPLVSRFILMCGKQVGELVLWVRGSFVDLSNKHFVSWKKILRGRYGPFLPSELASLNTFMFVVWIATAFTKYECDKSEMEAADTVPFSEFRCPSVLVQIMCIICSLVLGIPPLLCLLIYPLRNAQHSWLSRYATKKIAVSRHDEDIVLFLVYVILPVVLWPRGWPSS